MFIPLYHGQELKRIPFQLITVGLIAFCVIVFAYQAEMHRPEFIAFLLRYGAIPSVVLGENTLHPALNPFPPTLTLLSSMFLHGGWWHLTTNMVFLYFFGSMVEDAMGHWQFLIFYLLCGVLATLLYVAGDNASTAPLVGASGAVSGVIIAYLALHPRVKLWGLAFGTIPLKLPVWVFVGGWIALQFYSAFTDSEQKLDGNQVAWLAHVGGLIAGAVLLPFFKRPDIKLFQRSSDNDEQQ